MIQVEEGRAALFTRGTIDFYRLYPGMYVPVPVGVRVARAECDVDQLSAEILALSKMNWNQSQLDGRFLTRPHALIEYRGSAALVLEDPALPGGTAGNARAS